MVVDNCDKFTGNDVNPALFPGNTESGTSEPEALTMCTASAVFAGVVVVAISAPHDNKYDGATVTDVAEPDNG